MDLMLNIRPIREAVPFSQGELAKRVGVTIPTISRWESGTMYPESWRLPRIADALGCSIDALYGRGIHKAYPVPHLDTFKV